mmetsp:Transcript_49833/g.128212  ORF Transcript_49833/g.128212 Transcript_49833/m.128212 type:complete len:200 (-) Transcript_49833:676-1275(-)
MNLHFRLCLLVLAVAGSVSSLPALAPVKDSAVLTNINATTAACDTCMETAVKLRDGIFNVVRLRDRAWVVYSSCLCSFFTSSGNKDLCNHRLGYILRDTVNKYEIAYPDSAQICQAAGYCTASGEEVKSKVRTDPTSVCDALQEQVKTSFVDFNTLGKTICLQVKQFPGRCESHVCDTCPSEDTFSQGVFSDARSYAQC